MIGVANIHWNHKNETFPLNYVEMNDVDVELLAQWLSRYNIRLLTQVNKNYEH